MEDYDSSSALPLNLISTYAIYIIIAEEDAEEAEEERQFYIQTTLYWLLECNFLNGKSGIFRK